VVDIAVPPDVQPAIVHAALDAGKHVLAQKPLAVTLRDALAMVEHAERAGARLAVNQNGRYDSSINAARQLVRQGILGTRLLANIDMHVETVWQEYMQDPRYDRLMILNLSIHLIDQLVWLFGAPSAVTAFARKAPGPYHGDRIAQFALHYDDDFWATSLDDGMNCSSDTGHYDGQPAPTAGARGLLRIKLAPVRERRRRRI
jgi:predicted dehydrogenase